MILKRRLVRPGLSWAMAVLMAGCSVLPTVSQPRLDELIIRNRASATVSEVTLRNTVTGTIVMCSTIPANGECSVRFPVRVNKREPATLTWRQSDVTYSKELGKRRSANQDNAAVASAVVVIGENGALEVHLK